MSFYIASLKSGDLKELSTIARRPRTPASFAAALSANGKTLYLAAEATATDPAARRIVSVDVETGTETPILLLPDNLRLSSDVALSPDGHSIAFTVAPPNSRDGHLVSVAVDGTNYRQLAAIDAYADGDMAAWSGDGRTIFFSHEPNAPAVGCVMQVSSDGGTPQQTQFNVRGLDDVVFDASRTRIAYTATVRAASY